MPCIQSLVCDRLYFFLRKSNFQWKSAICSSLGSVRFWSTKGRGSVRKRGVRTAARGAMGAVGAG